MEITLGEKWGKAPHSMWDLIIKRPFSDFKISADDQAQCFKTTTYYFVSTGGQFPCMGKSISKRLRAWHPLFQ